MSGLSTGGVYAIEVRLDEPQTVSVGRLGKLSFQAGAYVYVGSARRGLRARIGRHAARSKPLRWHADYLTVRGRVTQVAVWPGEAVSECAVAGALAAHMPTVPGFGSSDCHCRGHLFAGDLDEALGLLPPARAVTLSGTE